MYKASFGLLKRPFAPSPRVDSYYPAGTIEAARQTLVRCIQRGEGIAMAVGPSGTGKTLLCKLLAERFRDTLQVVILSSGRLGNRRALLQGVLHGLGKPYRDMDEGELRIALEDCLTELGPASAGILLLVDEAHTLPLGCLDELRTLTNVAVDGQPRIRLVLAGASPLEERLAHPRLDSFSQRLAARCYLEAMTRTETEAYIHAQVAKAGGKGPAVFPPEACQAVFQATGGVPRLVNQVCDQALVLAGAARQTRVDAGRVQEAWTNLQQLPSPWNAETTKQQPAGQAIEFGALDDEPSAPAASAVEPVSPDVCSASAEPSLETPLDAADPLPAMPSVAARTPEPAEQIDEIQEMLGDIEEDFRPAGTIGPEVEIVLDDPGNPFSEQFLEEEVVIDRCAAALAEQNALATEAALASGARPQPSRPRIEPETLPLRRTANVAELAPDEPELVIDEEYDFVERPEMHPVTPVRRHEYRNLFARLRRA